MKKLVVLFLVSLSVSAIQAQRNPLLIANHVSLPKDTAIKTQLLTSLNGFLSQKERPNAQNEYVLSSCLLETSNLLDEMKGIESIETFRDEHFYKGYLSSLTRLRDTSYLIQLTYQGIHNDTPMVRAVITFMAKRIDQHFYFYSPLKRNTGNWKSKAFGNTLIYYKNSLNEKKAKEQVELTAAFDKRLQAAFYPTILYCCDDFQEALKLLGVDFKSDYSGRSYGSTHSTERDTLFIADGALTSEFTNFDPHDLWHSRLHKVIPVSTINKPVDEGCAYLYGGSWGLSWKEILKRFKEYTAAHPAADWLSEYNASVNFDEKAKYPLNVDMMINALIVRKLEKEKGFDAVKELLRCGKYQKDNENYFTALEKISGITKAGFNEAVWNLIRE